PEHTIIIVFRHLHPRPPTLLFPYTTLFRSRAHARPRRARHDGGAAAGPVPLARLPVRGPPRAHEQDAGGHLPRTGPVRGELRPRSEEHTSELQSRGHLVCRLLLEKKNN